MINDMLLEAADVARVLGLSPSMIRVLVNAGRLRAIARTRRGVRLFLSEDVEALRLERERRRTVAV